MKKVILLLFVAVIVITLGTNAKVGINKKSISCMSLLNVEAQACCQMEDSNGVSQFCWCGAVGYCICADGSQSKGRAYFM